MRSRGRGASKAAAGAAAAAGKALAAAEVQLGERQQQLPWLVVCGSDQRAKPFHSSPGTLRIVAKAPQFDKSKSRSKFLL